MKTCPFVLSKDLLEVNISNRIKNEEENGSEEMLFPYQGIT